MWYKRGLNNYWQNYDHLVFHKMLNTCSGKETDCSKKESGETVYTPTEKWN